MVIIEGEIGKIGIKTNYIESTKTKDFIRNVICYLNNNL
jgi:hypothetical protein